MSVDADTGQTGAVSNAIEGKNITADGREPRQPEPGDPGPSADPSATNRSSPDDAQPGRSEAERPRIVEERHIVGPRGEDEIEATDDQGRHWYQLRPEPRGRADVMGFNHTWWLALILIAFIALFPW
jgi:hypothetical protein